MVDKESQQVFGMGGRKQGTVGGGEDKIEDKERNLKIKMKKEVDKKKMRIDVGQRGKGKRIEKQNEM